MSYCRWSSDDWMCDVYVYEADYGFIIHVAGRKYDIEIPKVPPMPHTDNGKDERWVEWFKAYNHQMDVVKNAPTKDIGGVYDGQTFICDTIQETFDKLKDIKEHGYNVPQFVFDSIQDEINDEV